MCECIRILLELDPHSDPIAGRIGREGEPARNFVGYLELISGLERLRTETEEPDS